MRRRAMGQETEYGCTGIIIGNKRISAVAVNDHLRWAYGESRFLRNGARRYIDVGSHPEYATGECDSPEQIRDHVLAGDQHMADMLSVHERSFSEANPSVQVALKLFKNNVCDFEHNLDGAAAFGTHENYQTAHAPPYYIGLLNFLITRQIVFGAGRLRFENSGKPIYELSQRSGFTSRATDTGTTGVKPILNLRIEPHATDSSRLHLTHGDNNILPQLTALKFAVMDVLLTMIEEGALPAEIGYRLFDPVAAVKAISLMPQGGLGVKGHRSVTALDIQRCYFDAALAFVGSDSELAPKRPWVEAWGRHLDRLAESFEPADHYGMLDWATKNHWLTSYVEQKQSEGIELSPATLRFKELSFHDVSSADSLLWKVVRRWGQYDELAVKRAHTEPCATTRAAARSQLVHLEKATIDWERVFSSKGKYLMPDPLNPNLPPPQPVAA